MTDEQKPPPKLVAQFPQPIVGMVIYKDRLFVATAEGVFELQADDKFHEIEFVRSSNRSQP